MYFLLQKFIIFLPSNENIISKYKSRFNHYIDVSELMYRNLSESFIKISNSIMSGIEVYEWYE